MKCGASPVKCCGTYSGYDRTVAASHDRLQATDRNPADDTVAGGSLSIHPAVVRYLVFVFASIHPNAAA